MAIPEQIAEYEAALIALQPEIRGLEDLLLVSLSGEAKALIQVELDDRRRRASLLQSTIDSLKALEADGYPEMPKGEASSTIMAELAQQKADFDAAFEEFVQAALAASVSIDLGVQAPKPN